MLQEFFGFNVDRCCYRSGGVACQLGRLAKADTATLELSCQLVYAESQLSTDSLADFYPHAFLRQ